MFASFFTIALSTFISEDLTCIATGALIAQGVLGFWRGVAACLIGIFAGDVLLFLAGRWAGRSFGHVVNRFISSEKLQRASEWLSRRGPIVVLASRFTPGLRTATYFAAGSLRTRFSSFAGYFLLASIVWTPLVVGLAVVAGAEFTRWRNGLLLGAGVALASVAIVRSLLDFERRRKLAGSIKRLIRWEFWPAWAAYLPFAPYFIYLALRHRSVTLFTAANPAIPTGGLAGESKSEILSHVDRAARFGVVPGSLEPYARVRYAEGIMQDLALSFPIVLKPDVGERGSGVAVIRSAVELQAYLQASAGEAILQEHITGVEFGVFHYRYPDSDRGVISSITEKRFPVMIGDGTSTLRDLILRDDRAVCMADTYARLSKHSMTRIPAANEKVQLVEIGSHCRGSIFVDACHQRTEGLEAAFDQVCKSYEGFYFGRFDVRTPSIEAFRRGEFTVLELNGVGGEAVHVYDPSVSIVQAYAAMFRHWRVAFEIGKMNEARGARPMSFRDLASLLRGRFQDGNVTAPRPAVRAGAESALRPSR